MINWHIVKDVFIFGTAIWVHVRPYLVRVEKKAEDWEAWAVAKVKAGATEAEVALAKKSLSAFHRFGIWLGSHHSF